MYLSIEDITKGMRAETLTVITRNDHEVANQAMVEAQAEVESYLSARYDIADELQKDAGSADRLPIVVKLVRDIAIYNCHNFSAPVNMPENRIRTYDNTIRFLREVQAEKASISGLPRLKTADGATSSSYIRYGGGTRRS
jgi:phage gp36-like protein